VGLREDHNKRALEEARKAYAAAWEAEQIKWARFWRLLNTPGVPISAWRFASRDYLVAGDVRIKLGWRIARLEMGPGADPDMYVRAINEDAVTRRVLSSLAHRPKGTPDERRARRAERGRKYYNRNYRKADRPGAEDIDDVGEVGDTRE